MQIDVFYIILGVAGISLLFRLLFLLVIFCRPLFLKIASDKNYPSVSVVIAARNEYYNLEKNLPLVLNQDYPDFEVVVVDDCSDDETQDLLTRMQHEYPNLRFSWVPKTQVHRGKKIALSVGIKAAKNDRIVFTDADCFPVSKHWLKQMIANSSENTDFILGYGGYENRNGLLNQLIRFDTLKIAMRYFGYAKSGKVYMGVGRNMSYTKSLWFEKKGFAGFYDVASGDDDLFVNAYAKSKRTALCFSQEGKTLSPPEERFKDWVAQKARHIKTASYYPFWLRFLLAFEPVNHIVSIFIFCLLVIAFKAWFVLAVWAFIKFLETFVFLKTSKKVGEQNMVMPALFFDALLPLIYIIFALSSKRVSKKQLWK